MDPDGFRSLCPVTQVLSALRPFEPWQTLAFRTLSTRFNQFRRTNPSVLRFAEGTDPISAIEKKARSVALIAMDNSREGPPFDKFNRAGSRRSRGAAALDLANVLGTLPKLWMNLQATYGLDQAAKARYVA